VGEIRRYKEIMEDAVARFAAGQDRITDFNEGSAIYCLLDTFSRLLERAYIGIRQGYNDNIRLVPYSLFNFKKKAGRYAAGRVTFRRAQAEAGLSAIPVGTVVSAGDREYVTVENGAIANGAIASGAIAIKARESGALYNKDAHTVTKVVSSLSSDIVSVDNEEAIVGGTEEESDGEAEGRFKEYINGLSGTNSYAIVEAARRVESVRSVSIKNHRPLYRGIFNLSVYVDDGSGGAEEATIEAVRLAVEGDGSAAHPGHVAPGVNIRVTRPESVAVYFEVTACVPVAGAGSAEALICGALAAHIQNLLIGESVSITHAEAALLDIPCVLDARITKPAENVIIESGQIAWYKGAAVKIVESLGEV
jgi:hypothetical protein